MGFQHMGVSSGDEGDASPISSGVYPFGKPQYFTCVLFHMVRQHRNVGF